MEDNRIEREERKKGICWNCGEKKEYKLKCPFCKMGGEK